MYDSLLFWYTTTLDLMYLNLVISFPNVSYAVYYVTFSIPSLENCTIP